MGYAKSSKLISSIKKQVEESMAETLMDAKNELNKTVQEEVYAKRPTYSTISGWKRSGEFGRTGASRIVNKGKTMEVYHDTNLMNIEQHQSLALSTYGQDMRKAIPDFMENGVNSPFKSYQATPYQKTASINVYETVIENMKENLKNKGIEIKGVD